jgi:hypothetical protein
MISGGWFAIRHQNIILFRPVPQFLRCERMARTALVPMYWRLCMSKIIFYFTLIIFQLTSLFCCILYSIFYIPIANGLG